jgi:hypothetical protein
MSVQTETGQRSLMPINNKLLQQKDLSIHLFGDGFSFCTPSNTDYIQTPKGDEDFRQALKEYFNYYSEGSFNNFSVVSFLNPSTFVPLPLFDKKESKRYLSLYNKPKKKEDIHYDILEEENQVNVYSHPNSIFADIEEVVSKFELIHYNTLLYRAVVELGTSEIYSHQLFIHFHAKAMDLYLVKEGEIIFNNRFTVKNEDEFLYYVFFVIEQFDLNATEFELVFLGKIERFESYYQIVKQYHQHIKFEVGSLTEPLSLLSHQAPYLAPYFS